MSIELNASQLAAALGKLDPRPVPIVLADDDGLTSLTHLAEDFLLWLWYSSEINGGAIELIPRGDGEEQELPPETLTEIEIHIEDRLGFRFEDNLKVSTLCTLDPDRSPEVRTAAKSGKRLSEMRIRIVTQDSFEMSVTLKGGSLLIHGLKLPPMQFDDPGDPLYSLVNERMYGIELADSLIAKLFVVFARERVDGYRTGVGGDIVKWISEG